MSNLQELLQLRDRFRNVLRAAARFRDLRQEIVQTATGPECEWAEYERQHLLGAVNEERERRKLGPVTMEQIREVDLLAAGHVDYADKIALYCAEMVLGIDWNR